MHKNMKYKKIFKTQVNISNSVTSKYSQVVEEVRHLWEITQLEDLVSTTDYNKLFFPPICTYFHSAIILEH